MKMSLFEYWCLISLLMLPLFRIAQVNLGGIGIGVFELLFLLQIIIITIYFTRPKFHLAGSQLAAFLVFLFLIIYQYIVSIYVHDQTVLLTTKIILGQALVFLTFIFFSKVNRQRIPQFVEILSLIAALVVIITIMSSFSSSLDRLDSPLWGRTNVFAATLVPIFLASISSYLLFKNKRILLLSVICFVGLLLTQSRGGFVALMIGLGLMILIYINHFQRLMVIIVFSILTIFLFATIRAESIMEQVPVFERIAEDVEAVQEFLDTRSDIDRRQIMSGRLYFWESAIASIRKYPLYGTDNFVLYIPQWVDSPVTLSEIEVFAYHNWLLTITARWGIGGLFLNLLFLIIALVPLLGFRKNKEIRVWSCILIAVLFHGLVEPIFETGFTAFNLVSIIFWMLLGLGYQLRSDRLTEGLDVA